jgi:CheY-like chemotaxis protein
MDAIPPIVVVEDETLVRLVVTDELAESGYSVLEAENGTAAVELIDGAPQLGGLVTDIRMGPGATGWEVAHYARAKFPGLPVIYVTGDSMAEWQANGVPLSVALQKPFASAKVATVLTGLLMALETAPLAA